MSVTTPVSDPRFPSRGYKMPHTDREVPPPEPIPDPVADFVVVPSSPTVLSDVSLDGSISTPAEHIVLYRWRQVMPEGGGEVPTEAPVLRLGMLAAGLYVISLIVELADGRTHQRQRTFTVTATETDEPDPEPDPEA